MPSTPELAQERAKLSELIRTYESKRLIQKANRWGIDVPYKQDWYAVETEHEGRTVGIILPYLNETATAIFEHRIRKAKLAFWTAILSPVIAILSLIVAILALLGD